jgi:hypothetical protein
MSKMAVDKRIAGVDAVKEPQSQPQGSEQKPSKAQLVILSVAVFH